MNYIEWIKWNIAFYMNRNILHNMLTIAPMKNWMVLLFTGKSFLKKEKK